MASFEADMTPVRLGDNLVVTTTEVSRSTERTARAHELKLRTRTDHRKFIVHIAGVNWL